MSIEIPPRGGILSLFYLFDHCGALRAFFKPNFFLSTSRESRVRYPAFFNLFLKLTSKRTRAREIPCLMASACAFGPLPLTFIVALNLFIDFSLKNGLSTVFCKIKVGKYSL